MSYLVICTLAFCGSGGKSSSLEVAQALHLEFKDVEFAYECTYGEPRGDDNWVGEKHRFTGRARYLNDGSLYFERIEENGASSYKMQRSMKPGARMLEISGDSRRSPLQQISSPGNYMHAYDTYAFSRYWILAFLRQVSTSDLNDATDEGPEAVDGIVCQKVAFPRLRSRGWFDLVCGGNVRKWEDYIGEGLIKLETRLHKVKVISLRDAAGNSYWVVGKACLDYHRRQSGERKYVFNTAEPTYRYTYAALAETARLNVGMTDENVALKFTSRFPVATAERLGVYKPGPISEAVQQGPVSSKKLKDILEAAKGQAIEVGASVRLDWLDIAKYVLAVAGLIGIGLGLGIAFSRRGRK